MSTFRPWSLALPLLVLAALVAACGGSPSPTPTPSVTSTPSATATATPAGFLPIESTQFIFPTARPTALAVTEIFFDHPDGELRWDGPDDRVSSQDVFHCGADPDLKRDYGIPDLIVVDGLRSFFSPRSVSRGTDWAWTGYYTGDWQLWQEQDASVLYLVHAQEPRAAFEYLAALCD